MINLSEREQILQWVDQACVQGARRAKACALLGISVRTLQRWRDEQGTVCEDARPQRDFVPNNKLSEAEREQMLAIANSQEFASLPPSTVCADAGRAGRVYCFRIKLLSGTARS